ncbi:Purine nucleoside phosphorylase DeoD-type [compost metagenome]
MSIPTPHMTAGTEDIAKTVLMPADPLAAQYIAENFLYDSKRFNQVRNMLGYTGTYKGKKISVMGSGIGMPSTGIYTYELFQFYGVERIVKLGFSNPIQPDLSPSELIIAMGASTSYSNYADSYELPGSFAPIADYQLVRNAVNLAKDEGISYRVGTVLTTDVFYPDDQKVWDRWVKMGVLLRDMETAALYLTAARAGAQALSLLVAGDYGNAEAEKTYHKAINIALELG